jgi:glycosyltransferase involved in cell wall biosynthesis
MSKKTILFIHQNFPGQFKSLAPFLAYTKKFDVHTLSWKKPGENEEPDFLSSMNDLTHHLYEINRGSSQKIHKLAVEFETKMVRADAVAKKCTELKNKGLSPDLIIDHPGWGETFFIKEIWPEAKILSFFEFYYNTSESDIDFDLDQMEVIGYEMTSKLIARNAPINMIYLSCDEIFSPTNFQKSTAPEWFREKINVIHDGIDTDLIKPSNDDASITINYKNNNDNKPVSIKLTKKNKIITFVNRNLEPYRGYHSFMRSLPNIQKEHPDAFILIIGDDKVSYGAPHPSGNSFKNIFLNEVKDSLIDINKIIFLGKVDYNTFINILNLSSVHVYLTYPFVLSWSMLEVMALEKVVVGSKTGPVEEVINDNENGLLVDFFNIDEISEKVNDVLSNPESYNKIRKNARKTIINHYDLRRVSLPKQFKLIERLLK